MRVAALEPIYCPPLPGEHREDWIARLLASVPEGMTDAEALEAHGVCGACAGDSEVEIETRHGFDRVACPECAS